MRWLVPVLLLGARVTAGSLPILEDKPWVGYFVAHETRAYTFGIGSDGKGVLAPRNRQGEACAHLKELTVAFVVEELLPDGRVVAKQIDEQSLETSDQPTTKPQTVKFRGKGTGGAGFEAVATFNKERMEFGGKVLAAGSLKHPLRFAVKVSMREVYKGAATEGREFERKIKDDELRFETLDAKRGKIEMAAVVDLAKECGKGLSSMRFEMAGYEGRRFEFSTTAGASIIAENPAGKPLIEGLTINWRPEAGKDPEGKARLVVEIR